MSRTSRRKGRGQPVGQRNNATPNLREYVVPPASDVVVTRPDGSVEFIPAMKAQLAPPRGSRSKKRKRPVAGSTATAVASGR